MPVYIPVQNGAEFLTKSVSTLNPQSKALNHFGAEFLTKADLICKPLTFGTLAAVWPKRQGTAALQDAAATSLARSNFPRQSWQVAPSHAHDASPWKLGAWC